MNNIIKFEPSVKPALLAANFEELEKQLDALLADDRVVVTLETVGDQKKRNAELNKLASEVKTRVKEVIDQASIHIIPFRDQGDRLVKKILAVREEQDRQVKAYEDEMKRGCHALLEQELDNQWELLGISEEFRKADISHLVKLTSLTNAGNLTKSTLEDVKSLAGKDKAQQTLIESRIMMLENKCLKAEINPPLTIASVQAFLHQDDFEMKLDAIISAELSRKAEAEERLRKKLEDEKQAAIDAALKAQQDEEDRPAKEKVEAEQREAKVYEAKAYHAEKLAEQERLKKEADSFYAEASAQADRIAQQAKEEADRMVMAVKSEADNQVKLQSLRSDLEHYEAMYARYPDPDTEKLIKETKKQLGLVEANIRDMEGKAIFTVNVIYKTSKTYRFISRQEARHEKIKNHFKTRFLIETNLSENDILDIKVN